MAVEYGWNTTTDELTEKVVEEKENVEKLLTIKILILMKTLMKKIIIALC